MKDEKLLEEARERFEAVIADDKDNRDSQKTDTLFVYSPGKQWPDDVRTQRMGPGGDKLCLEFNQLKQFVAQVVNDQRQNRPGVRVHPASGEASEEVAEILQGLIRGIEYDSKAEAAYDNAFQGAVVGGRGYWRIVSEYVDDKSFDQKLIIKPILDPNTVFPDIDYQQPDGSDRKFVFVTETIKRKEFERQWPKADPISWDSVQGPWTSGKDDIVIADYYRRVCTVKTMVLMSDGRQGYKEDMPAKETWPAGVEIVRERECETYTVEWYKIAGGQQVLEKYDWPGTIIPVVCTTGDDMMLDGKRVYQGLTRHARDAQAMLNYGMTQQAIHLTLTPRAPYIGAAEQFEGYENFWKEANTKNLSYLPYNKYDPDGKDLGPPPQRNAPSLPDSGWDRWCQNMVQMIRSTIGMYEQSLGMKGQEHSGRAILAREKQGDNATFNYVDNLARGIGLTGRILLECIPPFYDTERIVHIVGIDDERKEVTINQQSVAPDGNGALIAIKNNDITTGKYAVTVESGPSYATKRQESAETLTQMVQAFPPLMQVAGDLIMKAQDIPDAEALSERLKLTLPPPVQQALQAKEEGKNPPDPQTMAKMQEQQQHLDQAAQTMQAMQGEIQKLQSGAQVKIEAAQLDAQLAQEKMARETEYKQQELEANLRAKQIEAEINAQAAIEQANRTAALEIEKAHIQAATDIKRAMIDRMTKLQIVEMNNETQETIAENRPEITSEN
jgi:hypothetical protein